MKDLMDELERIGFRPNDLDSAVSETDEPCEWCDYVVPAGEEHVTAGEVICRGCCETLLSNHQARCEP